MGRLGTMLDLLLGRGLRLQSGGRRPDLEELGRGDPDPLSGDSDWIRQRSVVSDLAGRDVVPLFTTEEAARRWPGDGDVVQTPAAALGTALGATELEAAAIDPSSLEVLRRGPDAPDPGARWIRL